MSMNSPREIADVKAQHFWQYCITVDGLNPDKSAKTVPCTNYRDTVKRSTPNSSTWIRSVKIQTSDWEEVPPGEDLSMLPPTFQSIHINEPHRFIKREIQYNYVYIPNGYTIEDAPANQIVFVADYPDANSLADEKIGRIYIRQVTIDFEPWLEIHPSEHPNPPEPVMNIAAL